MIDIAQYETDVVWPADFCQLYRRHQCWLDKTFTQVFDHVMDKYGSKIALVSEQGDITYTQLCAKREQYVQVLYQQGLRRGDRVIIQLPNIPELVILLLACFKLGIIPVLSLPAHRGYEIDYIAKLAQATCYIGIDYDGDYNYHLLAELFFALDSLKNKIIIVGDSNQFPCLKHLLINSVSSVVAEKIVADCTGNVSASGLALLQLSGGSTGLPKLIPRTHNDYLYSILQSNAVCQIDHNDHYLAALPIMHNFPLSSPGVLGVLAAGGSVVLSKDMTAMNLFAMIEQYQITFTALVPSLLQVWLQFAKLMSTDLSTLRFIQIGGATLFPELAGQVYTVLQTKLQQVFGMAEGLVCYTRLSDPMDDIIHTQGRPMSRFDEVLLLDDNQQPVAIGQPGHLLVRGPYTIRRYFENNAAQSISFTSDGFYRTGDIAIKTSNGNYILCGREKDVINRGGEKIIAQELEQLALLHPDINDCALIGVPDQFLGEKSCLVVVTTNCLLTESDVISFIKLRAVATYKIPDKVFFISVLPKTAINKIDKKQLRKYVALTSKEVR